MTNDGGATGSGTRDDPWQLKTAPGTAGYEMWRDETADPPTLICQVGSTQLKYHLSAIDDLHGMLKAQGDWIPLGAADEQKPATEGRWRPGVGPLTIRSVAGTACARATAVGSGCTCRRCSKPSAWSN